MGLLIRWFSALISILPEGLALALGRGAGGLFGSVIRYHRKDAVAALQGCLPHLAPTEIQSTLHTMYRNLGMNLVESLRYRKVDEAFIQTHSRWEGREYIEEAMGRGKGVLGLTAHTGNWELLASMAAQEGYPMHIVVKAIKSPSVNRVIVKVREHQGLGVIDRRNALRECVRTLKRGGIVGFVLDQNMIDREGVFVDFFGQPACTTPGLAQLAALTQAPILPMFALRLGPRMHLKKILPPLDPPADRKPETIRQATQEYTRIIEQVIREHPEQWIWMHRRWKTQPVEG